MFWVKKKKKKRDKGLARLGVCEASPARPPTPLLRPDSTSSSVPVSVSRGTSDPTSPWSQEVVGEGTQDTGSSSGRPVPQGLLDPKSEGAPCVTPPPLSDPHRNVGSDLRPPSHFRPPQTGVLWFRLPPPLFPKRGSKTQDRGSPTGPVFRTRWRRTSWEDGATTVTTTTATPPVERKERDSGDPTLLPRTRRGRFRRGSIIPDLEKGVDDGDTVATGPPVVVEVPKGGREGRSLSYRHTTVPVGGSSRIGVGRHRRHGVLGGTTRVKCMWS